MTRLVDPVVNFDLFKIQSRGRELPEAAETFTQFLKQSIDEWAEGETSIGREPLVKASPDGVARSQEPRHRASVAGPQAAATIAATDAATRPVIRGS